MEIEGKRVLVTGASRGLGRALVTAFVDAGASEVLAGARKRKDQGGPQVGSRDAGAFGRDKRQRC